MKRGKLYGIGVGPGDPELLTQKAVRVIQACEVVAVPQKDKKNCLALRIAQQAVPSLAEKPILEIDMPMTKDPSILEDAYRTGTDQLRQVLDGGADVGFLTLGDPTVYSTYSYLHRRICDLGYETELIPGVPSFCAAAAALNTPLCENRQALHIIPGTYCPAEALAYPGVKVFLKNRLSETLPALRERNDSAQMVENCGLPGQRLFRSLEELDETAGYYTVLIVKEGPQ